MTANHLDFILMLAGPLQCACIEEIRMRSRVVPVLAGMFAGSALTMAGVAGWCYAKYRESLRR